MMQRPLNLIKHDTDRTGGHQSFVWEPIKTNAMANKTSCALVEDGSGEGVNVKHCQPCTCSIRYCDSCYHEIPDESLVKTYVSVMNSNNLGFRHLVTWKNLLNALPLSLLFFIAINMLVPVVKFLMPTHEPELPFYIRWYVSLTSAIKELYLSD